MFLAVAGCSSGGTEPPPATTAAPPPGVEVHKTRGQLNPNAQIPATGSKGK